MRTERSTGERAERATVSRRAFLASGASVVGTGFVGTSSATAGGFAGPVDVAATGPYRSAVRDTVDTDDGPTVRVHAGDGGDRVDVRISGRPIEGDEPARAVALQGWAALRNPNGEWRECRCGPDLRDQWASDSPVETWSESDWSSVTALDDRTDLDRRSSPASVVVRGTRSYQYARGHGGISYYSVDTTELDAFPVDPDEYVPVVRLAYLHVDDDAPSDGQVSSFLRHYDRRTGDFDDVSTSFVDPAVET